MGCTTGMRGAVALAVGALMCLGQVATAQEEGCAPRSCCWWEGGHVTADFLYWEPQQEQMQFAMDLKNNNLLTEGLGGIMGSNRVVDMDFHYAPGFRIGVGYDVGRDGDCWDLFLGWTRLHTQQSTSVEGETPTSIVPSLIINIDVVTNPVGSGARSQWNLGFDVLDLVVGRRFDLTPRIALRPYIGVESALINQNQKVVYTGLTATSGAGTFPGEGSVKRICNFHAIGPHFGMDGRWSLCNRCWDLFADLSTSLLYGTFHSQNQFYTNNPLSGVSAPILKNNESSIRPNMQGQIGIEYGSRLWRCRHVGLKLAYEAQVWWNIWEVEASITEAFYVPMHTDGLLLFHGLTLSGNITF